MREADRFPPVRDLAAIGDKRTIALVARDGTLEWMCVAGFDGDPVFASLLDRRRGGRFALAPADAFEARRRYLPDTNVLETTFATSTGEVRVTDALTLASESATPYTELVRRIDGVAGRVELAWHLEPRFDFGRVSLDPVRQEGASVFHHGDLTITLQSHRAGEPHEAAGAVHGRATVEQGDVAALVMGVFDGQPAALASLDTACERLDLTRNRWERWAGMSTYDGPWRDAVMRSALALDLLVDDATGAIVAAPTTSLPERIGGERNYDYRYAWLRDANLTLEAMMRLGYHTQVQASMAWMFRAIDRTAPLLRPIYRVDGTPRVPQSERHLRGYRGSRPVHVGNSAESQLQLGNWGDLLDATWHYVDNGHVLHPRAALRLADAVDLLARVWRREDACLWELGDEAQYTQSKLASWNALRRALQLAERGQLPTEAAHAWERQADRIRTYIHDRCWSERHGAWARRAGSEEELDASVLLASRGSFFEDDLDRLSSTVDAIFRELGAGEGLLYRYSGMQDEEGAFVACSFWAVEAMVRSGRVDEAGELMDTLVAHANDVGLLSEEIDPSDGAFLGNFPQALSHLALVNAADVCRRAEREAVNRPTARVRR